MNDSDNVNYLMESSSNDNKSNLNQDAINNIFNGYLNINSTNKIFNKNFEKNNTKYLKNQNLSNNIPITTSYPISNSKGLNFDYSDEIYIKCTEKLMFSLNSSIDYFNDVPKGLTCKSSDLKEKAIKMLKDELYMTKSEKEIIKNENKNLKDKIKILLKSNSKTSNNLNTSNINNSLSKSNQNISNASNYIDEKNVPVNKIIESFLKLQLKYDELEKENNYLIIKNEDLSKRLITTSKKSITEVKEEMNNSKYSPYHKFRPKTKSNNNNHLNIPNDNRINKGNNMENLIKEQLKCMQKMLSLVQVDKSIHVSIIYNYFL
jgi:hypothetical protein